MNTDRDKKPILVIGSSGKTGSRVAARLRERGVEVREGSRSSSPPFDWDDRDTWGPALEGVRGAYVSYYPDIAVPGAADAIAEVTALAIAAGAEHLVLLSGRGEPEARRCERILEQAEIDSTIIRSSWFAQNFSESFFREPLLGGVLALPANGVAEPFIDVEDIAEIAAVALTEDGHRGELYEVTGPRLLTFGDAVGEIAGASGRELRYEAISNDEFRAGLAAEGVPDDVVGVLDFLFNEVLDGRNQSTADGVRRALGREPRDFADFAREAAAKGAWDA